MTSIPVNNNRKKYMGLGYRALTAIQNTDKHPARCPDPQGSQRRQRPHWLNKPLVLEGKRRYKKKIILK